MNRIDRILNTALGNSSTTYKYSYKRKKAGKRFVRKIAVKRKNVSSADRSGNDAAESKDSNKENVAKNSKNNDAATDLKENVVQKSKNNDAGNTSADFNDINTENLTQNSKNNDTGNSPIDLTFTPTVISSDNNEKEVSIYHGPIDLTLAPTVISSNNNKKDSIRYGNVKSLITPFSTLRPLQTDECKKNIDSCNNCEPIDLSVDSSIKTSKTKNLNEDKQPTHTGGPIDLAVDFSMRPLNTKILDEDKQPTPTDIVDSLAPRSDIPLIAAQSIINKNKRNTFYQSSIEYKSCNSSDVDSPTAPLFSPLTPLVSSSITKNQNRDDQGSGLDINESSASHSEEPLLATQTQKKIETLHQCSKDCDSCKNSDVDSPLAPLFSPLTPLVAAFFKKKGNRDEYIQENSSPLPSMCSDIEELFEILSTTELMELENRLGSTTVQEKEKEENYQVDQDSENALRKEKENDNSEEIVKQKNQNYKQNLNPITDKDLSDTRKRSITDLENNIFKQIREYDDIHKDSDSDNDDVTLHSSLPSTLKQSNQHLINNDQSITMKDDEEQVFLPYPEIQGVVPFDREPSDLAHERNGFSANVTDYKQSSTYEHLSSKTKKYYISELVSSAKKLKTNNNYESSSIQVNEDEKTTDSNETYYDSSEENQHHHPKARQKKLKQIYVAESDSEPDFIETNNELTRKQLFLEDKIYCSENATQKKPFGVQKSPNVKPRNMEKKYISLNDEYLDENAFSDFSADTDPDYIPDSAETSDISYEDLPAKSRKIVAKEGKLKTENANVLVEPSHAHAIEDVETMDIIVPHCDLNDANQNGCHSNARSDSMTGKDRPKKGRKRKYQEHTLRESKQRKYLNLPYYKNGKLVKPKVFHNYACACKNQCFQLVSKEQREREFQKFVSLGSYEAQILYVANNVKISSKLRAYKRKQTGKNHAKQHTRTYFICGIKVCKAMFINTFQISSQKVHVSIQKLSDDKSNIIKDCRGSSRGGWNKLPEEDVQFVKDVIIALPKYTSHYRREQDNDCQYLKLGMTIPKIYGLYKNKLMEQYNGAKNPVSLAMFKSIFYKNFNLRCKTLKKDTCNRCDILTNRLKNSRSAIEQDQLQKEKEEHLKLAEDLRKNMKEDMQKAKSNENFECLTYDLEKTLPLPRIPTNIVFYKRQLWLYNSGIHAGSNDTGYCYVWIEGEAGRGAQEVGSCLISFIKNKLHPNTEHLVLWSDCCGGQNRNIKIVLMLKAVLHAHATLKTITLKYLESGHTFLPNDTDFSKIEYQLQYCERIYLPEEYINIMKCCRKTNPLIVHRMKKEEFLSTSNIERNIVNRKIFITKNKVNWLKTKVILLKKENPHSVFMKTTMDGDEFQELDIGKKFRGKNLRISERDFDSLWPNGKEIAQAKLDDLQSMINLIPQDCQEFYKSLKGNNIIIEDLEGFGNEVDFPLENEAISNSDTESDTSVDLA